MSGCTCSYKQLQHSKLLSQFVFKLSTFHMHVKTLAPLHPVSILKSMLIQFIPSYTRSRHFVSQVVKFNNIAMPHCLMLSLGNFYAEKQHGN